MSKAKDFFGTLGITALLAMGAGGLAYTMSDVPTRSEVAVAVGDAPDIVISDPDEVLSEEDLERLEENLDRLDHPEVVKDLHFIIFETNRENVSDDVEDYLQDNYPDLLDYGKDDFADGALIIVLGLDPRQNGIYYGEDVAAELHLSPNSKRDNQILDAMKPGVKNGNIQAGLFACADEAMDVTAAEDYVISEAEDDRNGSTLLAGGLGTGAGVVGSGGYIFARNRRRKNLDTARKDYSTVTTEYAALAQRLPELDIRANSVSSAFADAELRKEWEEVRDRFFSYHDVVSGVGGIGEINIDDDKQALSNRKRLRNAAESVEHVSNAEDNINRMFRVEQGDAASRRSDLTSIREDVMKARQKVRNDALRRDLTDLERRINELDQNPTHPQFMDLFVRVLGDYRFLMNAVKENEFSDVKDREKLQTVRVYETGYFYSGYHSYDRVDSWHRRNVELEREAQERASSDSSSSASFSSGFSGSGTTSRF